MGRRRPRPNKNKRIRDEKGYQTSVRENKLFEKYYKELGIVPEEEWDAFMNALKDPLPITFRITSCGGETEELKKLVKTEYIGKLLEEKSQSEKPKVVCLPWYPDELAWQLNSSRQEVRKDARFEKLKTFLLQETESGSISRQEAVSMIPPMLMDVKPHHKVLDMCAAPGSKTAQLIEYLHNTPDNKVPEGYVIANDVDNKRCYLMTHQVKRLNSPCCAIINHDASYLPNLRYGDGPREFVKYDRILCDVPCSGDGTLRKNQDIWSKWTPNQAINLHGVQAKILKRGLDLLEVGGRLVYSTCSLNPVEDEAVIASMLQKCEGTVELVDVCKETKNLKYTSGISHWKMMTKDGSQFFDSFESVSNYTHFQPSMFPPAKEENEKLNLHRCMRVLPHQQDTGGFFIAVLQKKSTLPWQQKKTPVNTDQKEQNQVTGDHSVSGGETKDNKPEDTSHSTEDGGTKKRPAEEEEDLNPKPSKQVSRRLHGYKEDPYIFIEDSDPMWDPIKNFYGIPDDFPRNQVMYRAENSQRRTLYYVSSAIRDLVRRNYDRIKFINLGVKIFGRSKSPLVPDCDYRIAQEGLVTMKSLLQKRSVILSRDDFILAMTKENPLFKDFSSDGNLKFHNMDTGSISLLYKGSDSPAQLEEICMVMMGMDQSTKIVKVMTLDLGVRI
ncbi:RNA cytosine C(5)-methyltransferase NSUN2-like isoform X3 [Ostrea edulis]|uniref:RNA cytosine C(5)-methyltransferase NSUN2-like isoform X3 n=1 Tax=Ostrea edulis TaxID=37623 RepID=UPI0024AE9F4B|nr:RNA cytosine C(5)-methyltransferase NSUN2-like isoform X3 [Ostrea edulis]XP_056008977.1 RNA cytosine C(5)-methyltransferase NSUN2-like isoform X3 [Ostrea edulis]XP_056008979.1 RNA cytosine C(5)-methyltransferase NSUN2-like isoform X3 [Ostrea edulis]